MAAKATGESDKIFIYGSAVYALLQPDEIQARPGRNAPALRAPAGPAKGPACAGAAPVAHHGDEPITAAWAAGPAESARARDIFTRLYKPQSPVRKLRFMFAAAFGKGVYTGLDTPLVHEEPKPQYDYTFAVAQKKGLKARKKKVKPVRLNKRPKPAGHRSVPPRRRLRHAGRLPRSPTLRGSPTTHRTNRPSRPRAARGSAKPARPGGGVPTARSLIETHTGCDSRQGGGMP